MRELSKRDYAEYIEYVHEGRYKHGKFTRYLCRAVQDFVETHTGHAYDILLLSVPPQHGKSTTITETLPSWYLGLHPYHRVIEISYNEDFAKLFTRRNHDKIEHYGGELFGIKIGDPDTANEFVLDNGIGSFISRGISSGIAGKPSELMIIDDPIKNRQDADSETMRSTLFGEFTDGYKPRLAPGAKVIVIQTRWHKEDLYGLIAQTEQNVTIINFPVECETDTDELGRHRGDALFPEIGKDKAWLEDFKRSYKTTNGSRAWNALYRGMPTDDEGGVFLKKWWQYYDVLPDIAYKIISVDANFKEGSKSDNVAIQVWGKTGPKCYLIERFKQPIGFVQTVEEMNRIIHRHMDYKAIYIEDKANGSAIIDVLNRRYQAVIPVNPEGGKEARAYAVTPMIEAGDVYIHRSHYDLVNEAADFPNSDHDDEVDAMTQALNKLRNIIAIIPKVDPDRWNDDDQIDALLAYRG
jgi:predicted phage terminase large subunit-like protein